MKRSAVGYNFLLTPLLLILPMFLTTFHTFSQQTKYYQSGYFACREVLLVAMAAEHHCFVNPLCSCVLSDDFYPIHEI